MMTEHSQPARMIDFMEDHAPPRSRYLAAIGVAATAISPAVAEGAVVRIGRGLYQFPDSELDLHSALSFHQLTDQLPRKIWIAVDAKDSAPRICIVDFHPEVTRVGA